jgi:hypothetical protein
MASLKVLSYPQSKSQQKQNILEHTEIQMRNLYFIIVKENIKVFLNIILILFFLLSCSVYQKSVVERIV